MTDDKTVGYCKPPERTRWKKGQSGNPRGRPKTKSDILNEAAAILSEPVTAQTPDGRSVSLDAIEAAYLALCRNGLKGHAPSLLEAIRIMLEVGPAIEAKEAGRQEMIDSLKHTIEKLGLSLPEEVLQRFK